MRKTFTPGQKAHIAIAALSGNQTVSQIASENEVHPTQVNQWQKIAKEGLPALFVDKRKHEYKELAESVSRVNASCWESLAPARTTNRLWTNRILF